MTPLPNYTVADVETTFQKYEDGSSDNRPYNPLNKLVSVGLKPKDKDCDYYMINHVHMDDDFRKGGWTRSMINDGLKNTKLLVGHNIKFDLAWLRECGYVYEGEIWDTMLVEKLLSGNTLYMKELGLDMCCARYGIEGKIDKVREYWDKGYSTDDIPWDVLKEYGIQDCLATEELFINQWRRVYGT